MTIFKIKSQFASNAEFRMRRRSIRKVIQIVFYKCKLSGLEIVVKRKCNIYKNNK